jgi:hypothetical protein
MADSEGWLLSPLNRSFLRGSSRRVVIRQWNVRCLLVTAACLLPFVLISGNAAIVSGLKWLAWRQLVGDGKRVQARVLDLWTTAYPFSGNYNVLYEFDVRTVDGLSEHRRAGTCSESLYPQLRKGGTVEVIYSASDPSISRIPSEYSPAYFVNNLLLRLLGWGAFAAVSFVPLIPIGLAIVRRLRLAHRGQLLDGEVIKCKHELTDESGLAVFTLEYRFTTPRGEILQKTETASWRDLTPESLPEPGTRLRILYLSDRCLGVL